MLDAVIPVEKSTVTKVTCLDYEPNLALSLWRLKLEEWLNDETINAYPKHVHEPVSESQLTKTTILTNTKHFWGRPRTHISIDSRVRAGAFLVPSQAVTPLNRTDSHWRLAMLKQHNSAVYVAYYDSSGLDPDEAFLQWLDGAFPGAPTTVGSSNPQQKRGSDCGLSVLMGASFILMRRLHVTQAKSDRSPIISIKY
jgi:Ulp1 family protease